MAFVTTEVVEVKAWGKTVGALAPSATQNTFAFQYDPEWVRQGIELSPLYLPLDARRVYSFPGLNPDTWHHLPPAIADSLPDRFGNAILDAEFARQGASPGQATALDRLVYTGTRAMGALEFHPDNGPDGPDPTTLNISRLVSVAREIVAGKIGTELETHSALEQILSVGTSAGGARAKAVINVDPKTGDIRPGQIPTEGYESWLLKFDGVGVDQELGTSQDYGRIEYAYSLMAQAAGIRMMPTRLLVEDGRAHFMTKRFDRPGGSSRLHTQTLCALAILDYNERGTHDYSQLFQTLSALGLGEEDRQEAFRRMVFNWMAANCDDHTKNHSFVMDESGAWSLSPAYDITHAYNPKGFWTNQHLMSVNGKFQNISRTDLIEFAERHRVPSAGAIIGQVADALTRWPEFAAEAEVQDVTVQHIQNDFLLDSLTGR